MNNSQLYETKLSNDKKVLIIDIDDTLSNLLDHWLLLYYKNTGKLIHENEIKDWDLTKHDLIDYDIFDILHDPDVYLGAKPKDGAIEALKILQIFYDIYIVSSCNEDAFKAKSIWLKFYFPFIPIQHFIACTPKQLIKGDIMIDDRPENLYGFEGEKFVMERTFNKPENYGEYKTSVNLVKSWAEIVKILLKEPYLDWITY